MGVKVVCMVLSYRVDGWVVAYMLRTALGWLLWIVWLTSHYVVVWGVAPLAPQIMQCAFTGASGPPGWTEKRVLPAVGLR